jgi:hypothetical protein
VSKKLPKLTELTLLTDQGAENKQLVCLQCDQDNPAYWLIRHKVFERT